MAVPIGSFRDYWIACWVYPRAGGDWVMTADICAPTCSTSLCRPSGSPCVRRARATPRGCWWCARLAPRRPHGARSARAAAAGRPARGERHARDPGEPAWSPHRARTRDADRGESGEAARRLALVGLRQTGQAACGRRHRAFRRGGPVCFLGQLDATIEAQGRGRRGDALVRVPRSGARPGDRRARRDAAAALYRVAPRGR